MTFIGRVICGILIVVLLTSCASVNWNNRIGTYTYDDAVSEYGPPDSTEQLSNGNRVSVWTTSVGRNWIDKLVLTFDPQLRLVEGGEKRF